MIESNRFRNYPIAGSAYCMYMYAALFMRCTRYVLGPEVLRGRNYGTAVDMWSVGVITYIL